MLAAKLRLVFGVLTVAFTALTSAAQAPVATIAGTVTDSTRRTVSADGVVTIVRPRTPFNQIISPITLPEHFSNGDGFITQDVRVTRAIRMTHRSQLSLVGEVFNLLHVANVTGYSGVLNQPNYGLPSARVGQVFGSGGPRAFQLVLRLRF